MKRRTEAAMQQLKEAQQKSEVTRKAKNKKAEDDYKQKKQELEERAEKAKTASAGAVVQGISSRPTISINHIRVPRFLFFFVINSGSYK